MKDIEVELKFPLLNALAVIRKLNKLAKVKRKKEYQKDTYFIPKHRNFLKVKPILEWLRIRESKNSSSINYKNWHQDKDRKSVWCDEYESQVKDIESLKKIFQALDIKEIIVVEKFRDTWQYKQAEIAVDKVSNLGTFIELEAKGEFQDVNAAKLYLEQLLLELDAKVGSQDFLGYPFHMLKKAGVNI